MVWGTAKVRERAEKNQRTRRMEVKGKGGWEQKKIYIYNARQVNNKKRE